VLYFNYGKEPASEMVGFFFFTEKKMVATYNKKNVLDGITGTDILSLTDAKSFLRVDHSDEDSLITSMIDVAVFKVQDYTGQVLNSVSSVEIYLKDWANIQCPVSPLNSINSIKYFNPGNVEQTLAASNYWIEGANSVQPCIKFDGIMPSIKEERGNPIVIDCNVGYATAPPALVHAVRLLLAQYYDIRENFAVGTIVSNEMPNGIKSLISEYRNVYFV